MPEEKNYAQIALKYAQDCLDGTILACETVKQPCQRHLDDLARQDDDDFDYYFDPEAAYRICYFIETLPHVDGKWAKYYTPLTLEPWQVFITSCIFGWKRKKNGYRRFIEAYIEVCRKNGKTSWAAAIGLYMFLADDEMGAEVYCGATSEKQAYEVFDPASLMVNKNKQLKKYYGVTLMKSNLSVAATNAKFEPVIGKPGDGSSPSCAILDEVHEHKSSELYDTMDTGFGARDQPLMLMITTAGVDTGSFCYTKHLEIKRVLSGVDDAPEIFGIIYSLDKDDDYTDFGNWIKANPNLGVSVNEDDLRRKLAKALRNPHQVNIIKCKHLNIWSNSQTAWLDMGKVRSKCADPSLMFDDFIGKPVIISLDGAAKIDIFSKIYLFDDPELEDGYVAFGRHYLPEAAAEENDRYARWDSQGLIEITPGEVVDFTLIENELLDDYDNFDVDFIPYDQHELHHFANRMIEEGLPMVAYSQTVSYLSEPSKTLQALFYAGKLRYPAWDQVLEWMLGNVVVREDTNGNIKPNKERPENKIDGAVSLIMSLGMKLNMLEGRKSKRVYTGRYFLDLSDLDNAD